MSSHPIVRLSVLLAAGLLSACDEEPVHVSEAAAPGRAVEAAAPRPAPPASVPARVEHEDGLVVETRAPGRGELRARVGDRLAIHLRVLAAEDELESTRRSGIPLRLTLGEGHVVRALERALEGARLGAELRVEAPAALCYGSAGHGSVPAGTDLVFEVEVVWLER